MDEFPGEDERVELMAASDEALAAHEPRYGIDWDAQNWDDWTA